MTILILGIDIGKNSCSVVGVDEKGAVTVRRTMRRQTHATLYNIREAGRVASLSW